MTLLKIEAKSTSGFGRFFAELYYPYDASEPIATSAPIYESCAEAELQTIRAICDAVTPGADFPQSPPEDDKSNEIK